MLLFLFVLSFSANIYTYQKSFEICKAEDFKPKACEWHKKMVEANPKSKHYPVE
jgi:hypothetical protein